MQGTIDGIRRWTRKNWANKVTEWTNVTMPDHGNAEKEIGLEETSASSALRSPKYSLLVIHVCILAYSLLFISMSSYSWICYLQAFNHDIIVQ